MAHFSKESYTKIFDQLLSAELYYNSSSASEANIQTAIKRVLGKAVKQNYILLYSDLVVNSSLDVSFKVKDPDGEIIPITLIYGA
jgi:hypothetical protein